MTIAVGVSKQLGFKKETSWGVAAGASGGQLLRRVSSNLSLKKDTYQSNEIRPDLQVYDYRHGARRVEGDIQGELSPGTFSLLMAAACRRDFTTLTAISGVSLTMATSGSLFTVTRATGSWLTDGVKVGMVVQITAGAVNAANLNKNLFVISLTATVLTVAVVNGVAMVAEGPISSCTVSMPGKLTYVPTSGHTNDSFTFEHWFSDVSISHQYLGCRVSTASVNLPPTGMATVDFAFLGKDRTRGSSQYFTSPTAATTIGVEAAVNGVLMVNGAVVAVLTGLQFKVDLKRSVGQVVGSNTTPDIFSGNVEVSGSFSAYFQDDSFQSLFDSETEFMLAVVLSVDNTASSDIQSFAFHRVKVGTADINDGQTGLVQQFNFMALLNGNGGSGTATEKTTMWMQDSKA